MAKFDVMTTEVKAIGKDVSDLRQQINDFGEDLDGVKRRLGESTKSMPLLAAHASGPPLVIPTASKTPLLANSGGASLLNTPQQQRAYVAAPPSLQH